MPDRRRVTFLVLALRFSIALIAFAAAELLCERVWPAAGGMPVWVVVITMGLVGLVFALTARSVSRLADRVVLRDHADGYEAGRRLLHRMSTALPVEDVLPALAEITGRTLQVDRSEVRVRLDGGRSLSQVWPEKADPHGEPMVVPVRHDGGTVGEIEVDVPGVASSREAELLRQLVSPAGLAMSTVRLTVELQRRAAALGHVALAIAESNHRIGRARQIESAAVGAEIRDRVDPHLDSAIELIERASTRDGGATTDSDGMAAVAAVERAREEIGQGLDELRNLARRIYPPRLQDGGLTAALEGWQLGTDTGLDVPGRPAGRPGRSDPGGPGDPVLPLLPHRRRCATLSEIRSAPVGSCRRSARPGRGRGGRSDPRGAGVAGRATTLPCPRSGTGSRRSVARSTSSRSTVCGRFERGCRSTSGKAHGHDDAGGAGRGQLPAPGGGARHARASVGRWSVVAGCAELPRRWRRSTSCVPTSF